MLQFFFMCRHIKISATPNAEIKVVCNHSKSNTNKALDDENMEDILHMMKYQPVASLYATTDIQAEDEITFEPVFVDCAKEDAQDIFHTQWQIQNSPNPNTTTIPKIGATNLNLNGHYWTTDDFLPEDFDNFSHGHSPRSGDPDGTELNNPDGDDGAGEEKGEGKVLLILHCYDTNIHYWRHVNLCFLPFRCPRSLAKAMNWPKQEARLTQ